jgi:transposase
LLLDAGKSSESIAEYLFLSGNTVTNYLKKYQTGGSRGLNELCMGGTMSDLLISKPRFLKLLC